MGNNVKDSNWQLSNRGRNGGALAELIEGRPFDLIVPGSNLGYNINACVRSVVGLLQQSQ